MRNGVRTTRRQGTEDLRRRAQSDANRFSPATAYVPAMTELPDRVRRAFRDHGAFESDGGAAYRVTTTPFDGRVDADVDEDGRIEFGVTVRVPMLSEVAADVAPIVEEGWYETFGLRIENAGEITRAGHDLEPTVRRADGEAVVEAGFADVNERRGVDDAVSVVNYVEGTYVQGVIPGYEYEEPVSQLLSRARDAAGTGDSTTPN
jgi:hypothetical protein